MKLSKFVELFCGMVSISAVGLGIRRVQIWNTVVIGKYVCADARKFMRRC